MKYLRVFLITSLIITVSIPAYFAIAYLLGKNTIDYNQLVFNLLFTFAISVAITGANTLTFIYLSRKIRKHKKRITLNLLLTCLNAAIIMACFALIIYRLQDHHETLGEPFNVLLFRNIVLAVVINLIAVGMIETFHMFQNWKKLFTETEQLKREIVESQYALLKSQINPHFLFNSLNTLLTLVENDPVSTRYVENLSEFLRYVLQNRDKEIVLLRDELMMVRQYVYIQQKRFEDKLNVTIRVQESFYHYAVPPLALQMLIENAIKHNIASKERPLIIDIYIDPDLYLIVENKINRKIDSEKSTGIGLDNIKKRYLFLSGKEVLISEENSIFRVSIPLIEFRL